jgi:hypothetical protein
MKKYLDKSGRSGIKSYHFTEDHIDILFKGNDHVYRYKISEIGRDHLEKMIKFAIQGIGLSTYISQHPGIRDHYELIA